MLVPVRVFFHVNEILVDTVPQPFVAGSLLATLNGSNIEIRRAESDYLFTSIPWALIADEDGATFATPGAAMAYLAAEFAMRRPVGDSFGIATVAGEALAAGMPVATSRATGRLMLARADTYALAFVVGLAPADTAMGYAIQPARGALTLRDWTIAAGSADLVPGRPYFLAPSGGLTLDAYASGSTCVVRLGIAPTSTTLVVDPADPILL